MLLIPRMDFPTRITDAVADPPDSQQVFSETLIRLPRTFLCYEPLIAAGGPRAGASSKADRWKARVRQPTGAPSVVPVMGAGTAAFAGGPGGGGGEGEGGGIYDKLPEVSEAPFVGSGVVTYGSFNNLEKVAPCSIGPCLPAAASHMVHDRIWVFSPGMPGEILATRKPPQASCDTT